MQTIIIDPLKTQYSIQNVEFCDRERKLGYENRKYINIVKQTADQMEADIIDYPLDSTEKAGTAINAQLMNNIKEVIKQSDDNSRTAHQVAQVAYNNSIEAYNVSEQAKTNAEESLSKSNSTQAALLLLSEQVEAKQGTIVTVGGNRITEGVFEANTKLDVTTYNEDKALINQKLNTLENKEIIKNVTYDATTETFII